jgi:hypothetical protein
VSKRSININRLEIRLRGISPLAARLAVNDLGHELLGRLSDVPGLSGGGRTVRVDKIDAGVGSIAAGGGPDKLRGTIASQITASVKSKMNRNK